MVYRDPTPLDPERDYTAEELAKFILEKMYGEHTREAMARSLLKANEVAEWAREVAQQLIDGSFDEGALNTAIEQKLNDLEQEYAPQLSTIKNEVEDARGSDQTLGDRLDGVNSQLTQTEKDVKSRPVNLLMFDHLVEDGFWDNVFNHAIEYANGKTVFIPSGYYPLKANVTLTNNTSLVGENRENVIMEITESDEYVLTVDYGSENVLVEEITFKGTRSQTNNIRALTVRPNSKFITINRCKFEDNQGGAGITFSHTVHSLQNGSYDITENCIVSDCLFYDNHMGIEAFTSKNLKIINNSILRTGWRGVRLLGCDSPLVTNNTVISTGNYGERCISLEDFQGIDEIERPNSNTRNAIISNNTLGLVIHDIIRVQNFVKDVIINNNIIIKQTSNRGGIVVTTEYKDTIIETNNIVDGELQPTLIRLSDNEVNADSDYSVFKNFSLTYCRINGQDGFPSTVGILITDRVQGSSPNIRQIFRPQRSSEEYHRHLNASNNWTTWRLVSIT